jgi:hypothetical protein
MRDSLAQSERTKSQNLAPARGEGKKRRNQCRNITTSASVVCWATLDASGVLRVVVLNKDQSASGKVFITLSGNYGHGQLKLLSAPSASSTTGVTY